MSREFEAFSRITLHVDYDNDSSYDCLCFEDDCKIVEAALQELQTIKEIKALEALCSLERLNCHTTLEYQDSKEYYIVRQYIHKSQEHNKVLSIIKEKMVNLLLLELAENVDEYNKRIVPNGRLTEEQFIILKRWQNE